MFLTKSNRIKIMKEQKNENTYFLKTNIIFVFALQSSIIKIKTKITYSIMN